MRLAHISILCISLSGSFLHSTPAFAAEDANGDVEPASEPEKPKKKPAKVEPPKAEEEIAETPEGTVQAEKTPPPIVRSPTSLALDERLALGTGLGWTMVKPSTGKWEGLGGTTLLGSWRRSPKPDGILFITGSYTPFAGTWLVDERYYNATAHAFMVGAAWLMPFSTARIETKAGVELGYVLVYASPQDRAEADGKAKAGKFAAGANIETNWTVLNKMKVGPTVRLTAGGFGSVFAGATARYVF